MKPPTSFDSAWRILAKRFGASLVSVKKGDVRFRKRLDYLERAKSANKLERAGMEIAKRLRHWLYIRRSPQGLDSCGSSKLLVVTIAFNSPELIRLQAEALGAFLEEDFCHIVVDNSPDADCRLHVMQAAREFGSSYLAAPANPYSWIDPSVSHAFALDWAWKQIAKSTGARVVAFLDHDVFPTQQTSVEKLLGNHLAAGYKRRSDRRWILWPGLLVVNFSQFSKFRVSFMPRADTDAGGSLWWAVYSRVAPAKLRFLDRTVVSFGDTSRRFGDGSPGEFHVFEDGWVHLIDGSGWGDGVGKLDRLPVEGESSGLGRVLEFVARSGDKGEI